MEKHTPTQLPITYVRVDLDAIAHNVQAIRQHINPEQLFFAVVKANAYGHGAIPVSRVALENGADQLAVGRVDEAIELRRAGIQARLLVLSYTMPREAAAIVEHDITPAIMTMAAARALSARAEAAGRVARVHIKIDTGMGRYGLLPDEVLPFMRQVESLPSLDVEGIFTHFAVADEGENAQPFTGGQFDRFGEVLTVLKEAGYTFKVRHAANSAATLEWPATHLDAVRAGVAMYGLYPSGQVARTIPLKPALSLHSHVARVRTLPPRSTVGYGRTFTAEHPTQVVLVPVGYGDGYHRMLSNRGSVLINGQRAPIAGRVSMDQMSVDATGIDVQQDDEVVLLGSQGGETITAEEIARHAGTINYEVVTSLTRRVPRVYVQGGEIVEVVGLPDCS